MKRILHNAGISALLCSAVLAATPVLAQGLGVGGGAGATAGVPGTGIGANAGAGTGIGTTTTGTLNSNAAVNANGAVAVPNRTPSTVGIGASNSAGASTNLGGMSANGGINTAGNNGVNTSDQQTEASRLAEKAQANANAVQTQPRQLNPQATINSQTAATANGTVPSQ